MAEAMVLEWDQQKFRKTIKHSQRTNTSTFYTSPSVKLYKLFCSQFDAFRAKVAPQEVILKTMGATHQWHQREADPKFITVKDLLVGEEGDWLTMDDGDLQLKRQTKGPFKDSLLNDNETAVASNKYCKSWNDPEGPCPCHPGSCHKWKDCSLFQEQQVIQRGTLTFDPSPPNDEQDQNWTAKDPQAKLL